MSRYIVKVMLSDGIWYSGGDPLRQELRPDAKGTFVGSYLMATRFSTADEAMQRLTVLRREYASGFGKVQDGIVEAVAE